MYQNIVFIGIRQGPVSAFVKVVWAYWGLPTIRIDRKLSVSQRIYTVRGVKIMLDLDLAELYRIETKD